jgi:hypothetical protein
LGKRSRPCPPPPEFLRASLELKNDVLHWRADFRNWGRAGQPAGTRRPGGLTVVSIRWKGRIRTLRSERAIYALKHGVWPQGRVDENGEDKPRRARSPGRRGGLAAERSRDMAMLDAIDACRATKGGPAILAALAEATGSQRTNARRRLVRLAESGLVQAPPKCAPGRGYFLTEKGREATLADLVDLPPRAPRPWVKPLTAAVRSESYVQRFG